MKNNQLKASNCFWESDTPLADPVHIQRMKEFKLAGIRQSILLAGLILAGATGSAQAATFYSYASTSGNPGPSGNHIFLDSGSVPVESRSSHLGARNLLHDSGLISSLATVNAEAFSRADMNGLHLKTQATGTLRDAQPYRSETFATSANARAAMGDSFVIQSLSPSAVWATTSMSLGFSVDALMTGYAYVTPLDPLNPGGGEGRSRWHADFVAYDDTAGMELGRITLDQTCAMSTSYNFGCFGDLPGTYVMNISAAFGHTLSISLNGETWASASGAEGRGGDVLAGGLADLSHTISWGGISNMRDENGQPITGFTAISASTGYDYVNAFPSAVPVPATAWLLGSGLLGLIGVARRKHAV